MARGDRAGPSTPVSRRVPEVQLVRRQGRLASTLTVPAEMHPHRDVRAFQRTLMAWTVSGDDDGEKAELDDNGQDKKRH